MIFIYCLLLFALGILSSTLSHYILILSLTLILLYITNKTNEDKLEMYILVFSFIIGYIRPLLFISSQLGITDITGFVYKSSENYSLIATIKGNYYISGKYEFGDILKLSGNSTPLSFSHYESSFDFKKYLNQNYVHHEFKIKDIIFIFKNPIRINSYKLYCLKYLNSECAELISSLLFGSHYSENTELNSLGLLRFITLSSFQIAFITSIIDKSYSKRHENKKFILKVILVFLCLSLSNGKFAFVRILISLATNFILKKKKIHLASIIKLALNSFIILLINPYWIYNYGFYYAFIILLFISFVNLNNKHKKFKIYFITLIAITPLFLYSNKEFNIFFLILGFILGPLYILFFFISLPLLFINKYGVYINYICKQLLNFNKKIAQLSVFNLTSNFNIVLLILSLIFSLLFFYYLYIKNNKKAYSSLAFNVALLIISLFPKINYNSYIRFIDVGQGDSTLVQIKEKAYLFDTGGNQHVDMATKCLIPYFNKIGIRKLEAVFITHRDYDHYGALESLNKNFIIKNIYYNDLSSISFKNIKIENLNKYNDGSSENHDSAVYYVTIQSKTTLLIMGDAPKSIENMIMNDSDPLNCDYLKIGHHGANTSSSFSFLNWLTIGKAIISCGENNFYGHPHQETISNLEALNIPYYRTDMLGTIDFKL